MCDYTECDCGLGHEALPSPHDNDLLCLDCRRMLKQYGWCMAHAARMRKEYGDDWTPAQGGILREPYRQPRRKHSRGWRQRKEQ